MVEQSSLFDEPPQEMPPERAVLAATSQKAVEPIPAPPAPLVTPDDADRHSYASLADYIAGCK